MSEDRTGRTPGSGADRDLGAEETDPYRELFEHSADAILIIEGETFVDCNQAAVEMLRYDEKALLLSIHPSELSPPKQPDGRDSFEKANEMIAIALKEGSHRFEWDHKRADGEVFPVEVLLTAVQERGKRMLHVVWRDITQRKQLERQLRHAQKMEAMGMLAGGIAHDFNNLLVAILGNAELLSEQLASQPRLLENVEEVRSAGERAAALVRQLMAFSRKQELQPHVLDLDTVLQDLQKLLERLIGEDVQLVTSCPPDRVRVLADPGQIEQVVINLVTNARDAMPEGGVLSLELRTVEVGDGVIGASGQLEPGSYALLSLSDTGHGMEDETVRRAFDPFFTTKAAGKGTGLGLSTVFGIVAQGGGTVAIVSAPGHGTTVKVYLPLADAAASETPSRATDPLTQQGGTETILVAEDEDAVSALVVSVLRSKGYRVLLARDGAEALALWRRHRDAIDLLITDVVMPNLGGVELVRALRSAGADPAVLFASGYSDSALAHLRQLGQEVDLLEKPFTLDELIGRVRLALDRRKPPVTRPSETRGR